MRKVLLCVCLILSTGLFGYGAAQVTHWVPGRTTKDGRYIPGHMAKGPAHRLPKVPTVKMPRYPSTHVPVYRAPKPPILPSTGIDLVYVTRTGKTYHRQTCSHVSGRSTVTTMTVEEARAKGYKPCKSCHPPE